MRKTHKPFVLYIRSFSQLGFENIFSNGKQVRLFSPKWLKINYETFFFLNSLQVDACEMRLKTININLTFAELIFYSFECIPSMTSNLYKLSKIFLFYPCWALYIYVFAWHSYKIENIYLRIKAKIVFVLLYETNNAGTIVSIADQHFSLF